VLKYLRLTLYSTLAALAAYVVARRITASPVHAVPAVSATGGQGTWFERARPHCNAVEVESWMRHAPPERQSLDGVSFAAACYALAGAIDSARALIYTLPPDDRYRAAGVVFEVGHPVADMGDDRSAGPIMELVVHFWPNHYMALYHAGASAYQLGRFEVAAEHLRTFLQYYTADDGWTGSAQGMLDRMREAPHEPPAPLTILH
jgi:hypothetical protein